MAGFESAPDADERDVVAGGHRIRLKHLEKVMYPQTGFTKAAMLDYYARISPVMLPHIRDRAVTLKRYPHGSEDISFFEKACPKYRPDWINTVGRWHETAGRTTEYCLVNSMPALVWLVNQATIEFHVPLAMKKTMQRPRVMVYDLDPGEGSDVIDCAEVAVIVRERLAQDKLKSWIKTSGSKGLQLYVPLNNPRLTFDDSRAYAHELAIELSETHPELIVSKMPKKLRKNRVLIDWSQNHDNKTTICVYSMRGRPQPTVSTPVTWEEVEYALDHDEPESLVFETGDVLDRVDEHGDLFAEVLKKRQSLPRTKEQ